MYECPHDNKLLEGRAGGIFCRGCGSLFKSFAEINPKEEDPADNGINADDNGNGEADNEALTETEHPEGTNTEPTVTDDDPEEETPPAEDVTTEGTAEDEAEAKPKPARRGRPKKEEADNG